MAFVLPALSVYLAIIAFPIISSVGLSFTNYNIYKNLAIWTGLANYIKIFKDPIFWFSMRNNFFVISVSVFGQIPLGFALAYFIYRKIVKRSGFFSGYGFSPNCYFHYHYRNSLVKNVFSDWSCTKDYSGYY